MVNLPTPGELGWADDLAVAFTEIETKADDALAGVEGKVDADELTVALTAERTSERAHQNGTYGPIAIADPASAQRVALDAIFPLATQVPTLEELQRDWFMPAAVAATQETFLGLCVFDQRAGAFMLSFSSAVAASDTDYWTISLVRRRAGGTPVTVASKTTKATGGEGIAAYTPWTFDNVTWPSVLRFLHRGDVLSIVFTKTGAAAGLFNGCLSLRYEPGVLASVRDTFSRADASNLGTSDSGHAWTVFPVQSGTQSVFGIKNGQVVSKATVGAARDYAYLDPGLPDFSISAVLLNPGQSGLAVRMAKADAPSPVTGYIHNASSLFRVESGGGLTNIGGLSSGLSAGDTVTITCSGSTITVYRNGAQVLQVSDSTYLTQTKHGLRTTSPTADAALFDDLVIHA